MLPLVEVVTVDYHKKANLFDNSAISLVNVDVVFFSNFSERRPPKQIVVLQGYTTSCNITL
jgi:hypothetical protein